VLHFSTARGSAYTCRTDCGTIAVTELVPQHSQPVMGIGK